jgi:hypothetical protein
MTSLGSAISSEILDIAPLSGELLLGCSIYKILNYEKYQI